MAHHIDVSARRGCLSYFKLSKSAHESPHCLDAPPDGPGILSFEIPSRGKLYTVDLSRFGAEEGGGRATATFHVRVLFLERFLHTWYKNQTKSLNLLHSSTELIFFVMIRCFDEARHHRGTQK